MSGFVLFLAGYYTGVTVVLAGWFITIDRSKP